MSLSPQRDALWTQCRRLDNANGQPVGTSAAELVAQLGLSGFSQISEDRAKQLRKPVKEAGKAVWAGRAEARIAAEARP